MIRVIAFAVTLLTFPTPSPACEPWLLYRDHGQLHLFAPTNDLRLPDDDIGEEGYRTFLDIHQTPHLLSIKWSRWDGEGCEVYWWLEQTDQGVCVSCKTEDFDTFLLFDSFEDAMCDPRVRAMILPVMGYFRQPLPTREQLDNIAHGAPPLGGKDRLRLEKAVVDLDDGDYRVRRKATAVLREYPPAILHQLRQRRLTVQQRSGERAVEDAGNVPLSDEQLWMVMTGW